MFLFFARQRSRATYIQEQRLFECPRQGLTDDRRVFETKRNFEPCMHAPSGSSSVQQNSGRRGGGRRNHDYDLIRCTMHLDLFFRQKNHKTSPLLRFSSSTGNLLTGKRHQNVHMYVMFIICIIKCFDGSTISTTTLLQMCKHGHFCLRWDVVVYISSCTVCMWRVARSPCTVLNKNN